MNVKKSRIPDGLLKLLDDETKISTLFGLYLFETLNLKNIARILNKNESTTLRHLKSLINEKLIEIDQKKSAQSWGKFYRLRDEFKMNLENMFTDVPIKWDVVESYDKLASAVKAISSLINAVGKFTASYLIEKSQDKLGNQAEDKNDFTMPRFSLAIALPSVKTKDDLREFKNIITEFQEKIDKFEQKYKSEPVNNQIVYLFTAPLDEIHPLKKFGREKS